ncbi:hypothetical protein DL769_006890 [Monosporascus sp. CRB-8-3]|nr:hypothetical protein DL769_006890 [Monosporascus sp. CRB-8-3]
MAKSYLRLLALYVNRVLCQPGFPVNLDSIFGTAGPRNVRFDKGTYGPSAEEYHCFYDQRPVGLAARLSVLDARVSDHFVNVHPPCVIPDDVLWVADTYCPTANQSGWISTAYAAPGGSELVAVDLATDTITRTYTLPATAHYKDSYMDDPRFDLRPTPRSPGAGIAYMVDRTSEARNRFITIDLATGRELETAGSAPESAPGLRCGSELPGLAVLLPTEGSSSWGSGRKSLLALNWTNTAITNWNSDSLANKRMSDNARSLGQRGGNAKGFVEDSLGNVHMLMLEAIYTTRLTEPYVRDPGIIRSDSANAGFDGYLYLTINQLPYQADWNAGVEGRVHSDLILRSKQPDGASKNTLLM